MKGDDAGVKFKTEEGLLQLEAWARDGLTDEQIAANIGITRKTLAEWKNKYGDICDTLKTTENFSCIHEYIQNRFRITSENFSSRSNFKSNEQKICKN